MELIVEGVDVFNPIKGKEQAFIDCYVELYGEKYRDKITENFKNTIVLFVPQNIKKGTAQQLAKHYDAKIASLVNELLSRNRPAGIIRGVGYGRDFLNDILAFNGSLNLNNLDTQIFIKKCFSFLGIHTKSNLYSNDLTVGSREEKILKLAKVLREELEVPETRQKIKNLLSNVKSDYLSLGFKQKIESLEEEKRANVNRLAEIDSVTSQIEETNKKKLNAMLKAKMAEVAGVRVAEFDCPDVVIQDFYNFLQTGGKIDADDWDNYFAEENYIQVLKSLGIDGGIFLDDYLKDSRVQNLLNDDEFINAVNTFKEKAEQEVALGNPLFQEAIKKINHKFKPQKGTLGEIEYLYKFMHNNYCPAGYVSHQIDKETGLPISLCVLPWSLSCYDGLVAHEGNHIADMSIFVNDEGDRAIKSGFEVNYQACSTGEDFDGQKIDLEDKEDTKKRDVEMFNEVINEYFAKKVAELMRKKGITTSQSTKKSEPDSSYVRGFPLLVDFIEKHIDVIIESKISSSFASIESLGEQELEEIIDATNEFFTQSTDFKRYSTYLAESRKLEEKYNTPIMELAQNKNIEWSQESKPFIDCFRRVKKAELSIEKNAREKNG